jgi:hypothetical protein
MNRKRPAEASRAPRHPPQPVPGAPPSPALRIGIERVTLHGFTRADQRRFTRSLETSLAEMAAAHRDHDWGPLGRRLHIRSLDAGRLRPGASAEAAARQVARALFDQLTGRRRSAHRV